MPPERFTLWRSGAEVPFDPSPPESMTLRPVSTQVNTAAHDTPRRIEPVAVAQGRGTPVATEHTITRFLGDGRGCPIEVLPAHGSQVGGVHGWGCVAHAGLPPPPATHP